MWRFRTVPPDQAIFLTPENGKCYDAAMKRKLVRILLLLIVLLLVAGWAFLLWPQDNITKASYEKIQIGMTEKEVEAILSGPGITGEEFQAHQDVLKKQVGKKPFTPYVALVDGLKPELKFVCGFNRGPPKDNSVHKVWFDRRGYLGITFDDEVHVRSKMFVGWRPADPTFLERVRDWFGW